MSAFKNCLPALALLLLFGSVCSGGTPYRSSLPMAHNGVMDLRQNTFAQKVALDGEWQFYWQQFINPTQAPIHRGKLVNFPRLWSDGSADGIERPSFGYASYRLTILLPKTQKELRLSMPDVYSAYNLYVNGKLVAQNGKISTNEQDFEPYWDHRTFDIDPGTDSLKLVLHIANFAHSKGGIKKSITLGERAAVELDRQRDVAIDLLLTGCLFMGGLFFFGLYLFGNRDKAILLFSLYAMVYSYRVIGIDNYMLHTLLPNISWYITVRLEYITLFTGIGLFGLYSRFLYPTDVNKPIIIIISGGSFLFAACSVVLPPVYFTRLINPFLVVMVFCIVHIPYVYMLAYRRKRPGSVYALASSLSLMFVFAISLFHYWGFIPQLQVLSFVGYVSFFFLQSLVLSHRVSFVLKSAREQAEQGFIAKSEFLSTLSHEIRTPLNSVIGMSHLLLKNDPRPDQQQQLDVIIFSANNLLGIVNDILDYNKIEAGKITFEYIEMDMAAIARNVVNSLQTSAQDKGINLKLDIDNGLQNKLMGDPVRISQVITNLVHNAIKFTSVGYVELGISIKGQTDSTITLRIQVKDTGIGISKEKQAIIFERFTQADSSTSRGFGGTGLGLAISKRILELQNSDLQLLSEEGKGSTFYFIKNFEKSSTLIEPVEPGVDLIKEDKPFAGIDILLVEDNPLNVMVAQTFLKRWGANIDVAVNGSEALEKLDINKHRLVLMDLHMPVMDGYEASRKMRAMGVRMPIIALTANLPNEIEQDLKQNGIDDMVVKPFLPDELYGKVLHHIFKSKRPS